MLKVIIFDLGGTLLDDTDQPFPHVKEALTAMSSFVAADGTPLRSCLVSDYYMATLPVTPAKIQNIFNQYLSLLTDAGLRTLFEPVAKRVTLSTHAGVNKPDRSIFEKALQRLGPPAVSVEDCLLITENGEHIQAANEQLHMQTLHFGAEFNDWEEGPAVVAEKVAPHQFANTSAVLHAHLAKHGIDLLRAEPEENTESVRVQGQVWRPLEIPGLEDLNDVLVAIPVEGNVSRKRKNDIDKIAELAKPSDSQVAEVASFVKSLANHGQIAGRKKNPVEMPSHQITTDENGNRKLVRKGFSAI